MAKPLEGLPDGSVQLDRKKGRKGPQVKGLVDKSTNPVHVLPPFYFHPQRASSPPRCPGGNFRKRLREVSTELEVNYHPKKESWQIWRKEPNVTVRWCRGWMRLALLPPGRLPDDDVIRRAKMFRWSRRNENSGLAATRALEGWRESMRKVEERHSDESEDIAREMYDHFQPSTAGSGDKFARYHG